MAKTLLERAQQVLDAHVRPAMAEHQGNVELKSLQDGILKLRFLGRCSGCPGARLTLEGLVTEQVMQALPEIKEVVLVTEVSDALWNDAMALMKSRRASS